MTLSKKHVSGVHFAYLPHKCDKCYRVFWLEHYTMNIKYVAFTKAEMAYCSECRSIEKSMDEEESKNADKEITNVLRIPKD